MNYLIHAHSLSSKVIQKTYWTIISRLGPAPQIKQIHNKIDGTRPRAQEFIRVVDEPAFIEPQWGYIISAKGKLINDSMTPNFHYPKPIWRNGLPSPKNFLNTKKNRTLRVRYFPEVISLRHFWEWNYYHFYFDVLGKLNLFHDFNFGNDIPLVLGRYAMELPWVKQILQQGDFANRTWVIPDHEYVMADRVIYGCTHQDYKLKMDYVLNNMGVCQPKSDLNRRIFLCRENNCQRGITNSNEVIDTLREYGFELTFTSGLTIQQQITQFSNTRYLVANHGAGITNIIFRRDAPLHLLELHHPNLFNNDFKRTCSAYGHAYDTLAGIPDRYSAPSLLNFSINTQQLRAKIDQMMCKDQEKKIEHAAAPQPIHQTTLILNENY